MPIRPILSALLRSKTGAALVAAQIALTLAIVSNALFVVSTRLETARRPSGVVEDEVSYLTLIATRPIADLGAMMQRDREALRAIPGVTAVAAVNQIPMGQSSWDSGFTAHPDRPGSAVGAACYLSGDSLIDALGLRLVEGRDFEPAEIREIDARAGDPTRIADRVIVTRALARRLFPDESAVGKTIYLGTGDGDLPALRVVGVVERLMNPNAQTDEAEALTSVILPVHFESDYAGYVIRSEADQRARVMADADRILGALVPDRVVAMDRTMDDIRARRYRHERAGANLLIAVTIGLLLVTASGIVGVASLWVTQRRKQIGVRRALGATRLDILGYFVAENLLITTGGGAAGVALAIGLNQLLVHRLELERLPLPYALGGVAAVWALGIVAVLGPAWRAAAVPPAVATRTA